jgi:hypothetical protein
MFRRVSLLLLLTVASCGPDYPIDKPGTWQLGETGSNDANLRTMVANPRDLTGSTGQRRMIGAEAAPPVRRLLTGRRYPLPASNILQVELTGSPQAPAQDNQSPGQ